AFPQGRKSPSHRGRRGVGAVRGYFPIPENINGQHLLLAGRGAKDFSFLGETLSALDVEIVLIMETAEQAAARAGNLRRIEREVLCLRDRQIHGLELGKPAGTAVFAAAAPHAGEPPRFVSGADLA